MWMVGLMDGFGYQGWIAIQRGIPSHHCACGTEYWGDIELTSEAPIYTDSTNMTDMTLP